MEVFREHKIYYNQNDGTLSIFYWDLGYNVIFKRQFQYTLGDTLEVESDGIKGAFIYIGDL